MTRTKLTYAVVFWKSGAASASEVAGPFPDFVSASAWAGEFAGTGGHYTVRRMHQPAGSEARPNGLRRLDTLIRIALDENCRIESDFTDLGEFVAEVGEDLLHLLEVAQVVGERVVPVDRSVFVEAIKAFFTTLDEAAT